MNTHGLLSELKSRGVYRVAALYAAASWALLQIADLLFPILGIPEWTIRALLVAALLGLPLALIMAWLFDITPEGVVETDTGTSIPQDMRLPPALFISIGALVALLVIGGFFVLDRLSPQSPTQEPMSQPGSMAVAERPSIAVMPFVNMSEIAEVEYFGDGLAEEILNLLAKLNELDVAARTSSFYFKDKPVDVREIGERLGVDNILEGSVRRQGDRVRITAQLVRADTGFHLWSETFDRDFKDSFIIQDEIAREVVNVLQVILSENSRQLIEGRDDLDPDAYDYYLRGREYLRGVATQESLESAIELFSRAIDADGDYVEAYAGLCDSYLGLYRMQLDPERYADAESACQNVLSIGGGDSSSHVALGNLYRFSGDYDQAVEQFETALSLDPLSVDALDGLGETYQRDSKPDRAEHAYWDAIQLQPNYWRGYLSMGSFLFEVGRYEDAIPYFRRITELMPDNAEAFNGLGASYYMLNQFEPASEALRKALKLDPGARSYSNIGTSLFFLGRFDDAVAMYQKAVEYAPEDYQLWGSLGDAYRYTDDLQELAEPMYRNAIKLAGERLEVNPSDTETLGLLAHYYANVGDREQALQFLARASALAPDDVYVHYSSATAMCALGDNEKAREELEKAVKLGYSFELAQMDASLCQLANMPDFEASVAAD